MTSGQHIDYDALALEALRGVVKACLTQVSRTGLVGDHHFYIAFNTQAPGVGMSKRLKEKYPVEMTIVLQHRFWDLLVDDERFEVKLTFDGIPERLVVPFASVKVFYDPSVPYVLQFEEIDSGTGAGTPRRAPRRIGGTNSPTGAQDGELPGEGGDAIAEKPDRRKPGRKRAEPVADTPVQTQTGKREATPPPADHQAEHPPIAPPAATPPPASDGKSAVVAVGNTDSKDEGQSDSEADDDSTADTGGAKIFDLSKFRGKK